MLKTALIAVAISTTITVPPNQINTTYGVTSVLSDMRAQSLYSVQQPLEPQIQYLEGVQIYGAKMKTYESYKLFNKASNQYKLQLQCYTDENGLRYTMYNNEKFYCVAVGTGTGLTVGDYGYLLLEDGTYVNIIVGDIKQNIHTNYNNTVTLHSNCASEFIVDTVKLNKTVKRMGDVSYANNWNGNVVMIGKVKVS